MNEQDLINGKFTINLKTAEEALVNKINAFYENVKPLIKVDLNQNQWIAVLSLVFNLGVVGFSKTNLLKAINKNDLEAIKTHWLTGWKNEELLSRRQKEYNLFMKV